MVKKLLIKMKWAGTFEKVGTDEVRVSVQTFKAYSLDEITAQKREFISCLEEEGFALLCDRIKSISATQEVLNG